MSSFQSIRVLSSLASKVRFRIPLWDLNNNNNMTADLQKLKSVHDSDGYLTIGDYSVFSWSLSGIETSVIVRQKSDGFACCFDMGCSNRENVKCENVLIRSVYSLIFITDQLMFS